MTLRLAEPNPPVGTAQAAPSAGQIDLRRHALRLAADWTERARQRRQLAPAICLTIAPEAVINLNLDPVGMTPMSNPKIKYVNASNPAAFGVEWETGESGSRYSLVNPRGTTALLFGLRTVERGQWATVSVVEASRFGLTDPPRDFRAFMAIVRTYVEE